MPTGDPNVNQSPDAPPDPTIRGNEETGARAEPDTVEDAGGDGIPPEATDREVSDTGRTGTEGAGDKDLPASELTPDF